MQDNLPGKPKWNQFRFGVLTISLFWVASILAFSFFPVPAGFAQFPFPDPNIGGWHPLPTPNHPIVVPPGVPPPPNPVPPIANAGAAPLIQVIGVIKGDVTADAAAKQILGSQGQVISMVGQAVSETNAVVNNEAVTAAESIGGNTGKTVMTIVTGVARVTVEFASSSLIAQGGILEGKIPLSSALASPLAAAIRAAEKQYSVDPNLRPIPDDVRNALASDYPEDVLRNARYLVNPLSITFTLPDLTNLTVRTFQDKDNATTVGHITVFSVDPGANYHWWAHELQHQVQYKQWGIDTFAYKYITACGDVEGEAENKAQQLFPWPGTIQLPC